MTVTDALKDALHAHDKVAIPGLGTFVADYAPAYIHPTQHLFQPPHKKLVFLPELKTDDNVLLLYLMHINHVQKEEAQAAIAAFTDSINDSLLRNKSYKIEGLGEWYYDVERQLQFKPDISVNFMTEAYGLAPFVSEPAIRKSTMPEKLQDAKPILKKNNAMKVLLWIALLLVILLSAYFLLVKLHYIKLLFIVHY